MPKRTADLGHGVYTLAEVARYTQVPAGTIRYWFKGKPAAAGSRSIFQSDYNPVDTDFALSFYDLLDALLAGQLRDFGVPARVIRKSHTALRKLLDTPHPFCHNAIFTDGRRIFHSFIDDLGEDVLAEVVSRQQFFPRIRQVLSGVRYDPYTQLADVWHIDKGVLINPRVSFGKPVIEHTAVTTYVVANQYYANSMDAALVASLFCLKQQDVLNAVSFEKGHGSHRAA